MNRQEFLIKLNQVADIGFIKVADNGSGAGKPIKPMDVDQKKILQGDYYHERPIIFQIKKYSPCQLCKQEKNQVVTYRKSFTHGVRWTARCNTCHKNISVDNTRFF